MKITVEVSKIFEDRKDLSRPTNNAKMNYLKSLFSEVYIKDIVERKKSSIKMS